MKKLNNRLFIFFALFVVLFSCKKKDDEAGPSKELLLAGATSKEWKITAIVGSSTDATFSAVKIDFYNNSISGIPPLFPTPTLPVYPECAKDDVIIFNSNKTYQTSEGSNVCVNENYPFTITSGTWEFIEGGKKLLLRDTSGENYEFTVEELTETKITGSAALNIPFSGINIPLKVSVTFNAQ